MKKIFAKSYAAVKDTFRGLTVREAGAALRDTGRDVMSSRREALTMAVFLFASPVPGSVLLYLGYRLHMYRAKTGKIDAKPEPLLSDERLKAIGTAVRTAPVRAAKAIWNATPVAMKTTGAAIALGGAGVSTYATVDALRNPTLLNYSLLKECNAAMRRNQPCSPAGAAEKAKSTQSLTNLGMFAGGGLAIGAGALVFGAAGRRRK